MVHMCKRHHNHSCVNEESIEIKEGKQREKREKERMTNTTQKVNMKKTN